MLIRMIIIIGLVLWYFGVETAFGKSQKWTVKELLFDREDRFPERILYLIGWPVLLYLAYVDQVDKLKITSAWNIAFALIVMAWLVWEAFRRVSTIGETLPLGALAVMAYLAIAYAVDNNEAVKAAVGVCNMNYADMTATTPIPSKGTMILIALPFLALAVTLICLIANLVRRSGWKYAEKAFWLILLAALVLALVVIYYQLNARGVIKNTVEEKVKALEKSGTDLDPSSSPTGTVTTSDDNQGNEKAKLPDPKLVRDIFSDEESVKDLAAKWWSKYQYGYEEDGVKKIGYLMCMHSMPISRDERLFDDALSVTFSTEESWRQEMLDEHLNPFWFYAKASRLILIPEIDEAFPFLREYVELYEKKGPQYFTRGELVTDEYLKYAVSGGLFVNSSPITLEKNVKTETVWRLENGNSLDATKLKVVRRDRYEETKPWNDVLVLRHYSDKTGNSYLEIFDYYDRAPVILKEEDPKPTPSPTDKPKPSPTDKPKPSPTDKPDPTPSPTPDPTPSPTPDPTPTPEPSPTPTEEPKDPTQGTSSTNTEENDNKGTGENTNPAQPTSTPESTKEQDTNSTKSDQKDYEKKVEQNAPEPTTPVKPIVTSVPDCENGGTKEAEGQVFGDEKEAEKPTKEEPLVEVGDDDKPVVNDENNPAGSWRGGGRK